MTLSLKQLREFAGVVAAGLAVDSIIAIVLVGNRRVDFPASNQLSDPVVQSRDFALERLELSPALKKSQQRY